MKSHNQLITSVGLEISEEDQNLPYLYWTPKLHKSPYKHRFIAGSSKCTTKDLSCLLTKVLSTIKDGLVRYCNTKTSRIGVNNMWILKKSTSLLSSLDQLDVRRATSVQTFDFSTLYTSIPHALLKCRISNLVHNAFRKKDWSVRYTHIKVTRVKGYFTHDINGSGDNMYTADNAGINLTSYHPPRADCRATNFFRQNPLPGDSFSVQNSGPRAGKTKQNPHPRA